MTILEKVTALLGEGAVLEAARDRVPRIAPGSPDAVALLLGTAHQEGWRVRIEGAGTWLQSDAPADLALTTRRLDRRPAAPGVRAREGPPPRRHLRDGRRADGTERRPGDEERRRLRPDAP